MDIKTKARATASFIASEANLTYRSRDEVTVTLPEGGLAAGTILGKLTATSKYVLINLDAATGAEDVSGILFEDTLGWEDGDHSLTIVARDAEVLEDALTYHTDSTSGELIAQKAALATLGIIVR